MAWRRARWEEKLAQLSKRSKRTVTAFALGDEPGVGKEAETEGICGAVLRVRAGMQGAQPWKLPRMLEWEWETPLCVVNNVSICTFPAAPCSLFPVLSPSYTPFSPSLPAFFPSSPCNSRSNP